MPAKQERIRVDIWSSLKPVIEAEMGRSGLTVQEVVNIALVTYFGLSPSGTSQKQPQQTEVQPQPTKQIDTDEDYI